MASETEEFPEQLSSRNREDLALFLPFIFALTNTPDTPNPLEDSSTPDQETTDRIILINPFTQGMVVIEGGGSGSSSSSSSSLESLLRDLLSKDGQPPASKASIEAMPEVEITSEAGEECVICLEEWEVGGIGGRVVKEMPCKHRFHGECIEKWLSLHGSCPVCRYKMPVEDNDDDKCTKHGENGGRMRRGIWVSFAYSSGSSDDRRGEESNQNGSNDSIDSSDS
ncbi:hypothetical protein ACH5RR_035874 [Cinchona calisaya]|uniref:RING-type E3 ubiquitin transferase n=1 Tax=Cinchona calisaya TaxID=153742 RepID=A0ABD2Y3P0_9GENT